MLVGFYKSIVKKDGYVSSPINGDGYLRFYLIRLFAISLASLFLTSMNYINGTYVVRSIFLEEMCLGEKDNFHIIVPQKRGLVSQLISLNILYNSSNNDFKASQEKLLQLIESRAAVDSKPKSQRPDIIFWLNESVVDLASVNLDHLKIPKMYMFDNYDSVQFNSQLKVNTFGGGTWITEFEILSGMPCILFDLRKGSLNYVYPKIFLDNFPSMLKRIGYQTTGILSIYKGAFNEDRFLKALGIDRLFDYHGKNILNVSLENDIYSTNKLIDLLKSNNQDPNFYYVLTVSPHGPAKTEMESDKLGCSAGHPYIQCAKLNDYIARVAKLSKLIEEVDQFIMSRKKPTVFVYYGDHYPSFEGHGDILEPKPGTDKHTTSLHIRANFDIEHNYAFKKVETFFVPGMLLDMLGMNNSTYFKANSIMRDKCNGVLENCRHDKELYDAFLSMASDQLRDY